MIYKLLLIQDNGLAIAQDVFKQRSRRDSNRPCNCTSCGSFFTNHANLMRHVRSNPIHFFRRMRSQEDLKLPDLPNMNTSILYTCRLVHDEATPILYKFNSFCFSDLWASKSFRCGIGTEYACLIQEIRFHCALTYQKPQRWKLLSEHFPQLKRICLRLSTPMDWHQLDLIDWQLQELARHFRGLDWVHLLGPTALRCVEFVTPMIQRDSETGVMHVQKQGLVISPYGINFNEYLKQGHATVWWGRDGEQAPEGTRHMR